MIVRGHARPMNRVAIVGCSGGGKSTLARALGAKYGLPVIHLDVLFWEPGWVESDPLRFREAVEAAVAAERWVSDGNFTGASAMRLARADTIIWIEPPMMLCLWRAVWRALTAFGRARSDMAPGCREKVDLAFYRYIWTWNRLRRPKVQRVIDTFAAGARLIRLRGDRDVAALLAGLE